MTTKQAKDMVIEAITEACQSMTLEELAEMHDLAQAIEQRATKE